MTPEARSLERIRTLVRLWDDAIRIPVVGWRIGLDAIVGLVPGVGDLIGAVVSLYPIGEAIRLGAGPVVVGRMLVNVAIDAIGGTIPLLGDLFDVGWKANRLNYQLLVRWLESPDKVRRSTALALGVLLAGSATVVIGMVWLVKTGFDALR